MIKNKNYVRKIAKYIIHLLAVIIVCKFFVKTQLTNTEIITIAGIAAVSFVVLDMYAPVLKNF